MHAQWVKQPVCLSVVIVVVVVGRFHVLGISMCYKYYESVDIAEKLVCTCFELLKLKRLTSATNRAFSVQHSSILERVVNILMKESTLCSPQWTCITIALTIKP